jgi:hypothetical protein
MQLINAGYGAWVPKMMDTSFIHFNKTREEFDSPDAMLYEINGQFVFPIYSADSIHCESAFYVWDGKPHDGDLKNFAVQGKYLTNDTEENVREAVRSAFAAFRAKQSGSGGNNGR